MKKLQLLILLLTLLIALPSYANKANEKNNFVKMRKRFEKIDKNSDGLLSKEEMMEAHRNRLNKLFLKFDKNGDQKLSKKELRAVRKEIKKKINKVKNEEE